MRGLIQAARDLLDGAGPLIEHLPVIAAALGDAIAYRHDDGGACHDCHSATNQRCSDHVNDTAIAAAFHTALTAITS